MNIKHFTNHFFIVFNSKGFPYQVKKFFHIFCEPFCSLEMSEWFFSLFQIKSFVFQFTETFFHLARVWRWARSWGTRPCPCSFSTCRRRSGEGRWPTWSATAAWLTSPCCSASPQTRTENMNQIFTLEIKINFLWWFHMCFQVIQSDLQIETSKFGKLVKSTTVELGYNKLSGTMKICSL